VILDARIVGVSWFLGGYKGSNAYAHYVLSKTPADVLNRAWILTAPNGLQKIDENFLEAQSLNLFTGRKIIGEVTTGHRSEQQLLWGPKLLK
jgi:hypothetical protein